MRSSIVRALLVGVATAYAAGASAQQFPSKPVKIIVPAPAAGVIDASARVVAAALDKRMGSTIVENRPGADQLIGMNAVIKSEPDGYTLLYTSAAPNHPVVMANGLDLSKELDTVSDVFSTSQ